MSRPAVSDLETGYKAIKTDLLKSIPLRSLSIEKLLNFNRCSVPGWWLNGRVMRRRTFSKPQLKVLNTAMPLLKKVDRLCPWQGLSLIAVAVKN